MNQQTIKAKYLSMGYQCHGQANGVELLSREYETGKHCGIIVLPDGTSEVLQHADIIRIIKQEAIDMSKYTKKILEGMTSKELLEVYNKHAAKKLAKFQNHASGVQRTLDILPSEDITPTKAPKKAGACAKVWAMADSMPGAERKDVIDKCVADGINKATASTQYQKWRVANA